MNNIAVVIDNGSQYTKMGYGGNVTPEHIIPTIISYKTENNAYGISKKNIEYDYFIGNKAKIKKNESKFYIEDYPMQDGVIKNWDSMEKFWNHSIYEVLRCDPQEHYFVLSQPAINPPENREKITEIFFETFNVEGLFIGYQPIFAIMGYQYLSSFDSNYKISKLKQNAMKSLTGLVIEMGYTSTKIVPICDGLILEPNIREVPICGKDISDFILQSIKDRGIKKYARR